MADLHLSWFYICKLECWRKLKIFKVDPQTVNVDSGLISWYQVEMLRIVDVDSGWFMISSSNIEENEGFLAAHSTDNPSLVYLSIVNFDPGWFFDFKLKYWGGVTKIICWEAVSIKMEFIPTV